MAAMVFSEDSRVTVLLAGSGRKLRFRPISSNSDAFPMNQTSACYMIKIYVTLMAH
ncbi:hypothetical protein Hanom_Chr01g00074411 [Helianthus anomalus]